MLVFCTGAIGGIVGVVIVVILVIVMVIVIVTTYVCKKVRLKFIHYPDIYGLEQN